jgi:hypothetical protein
LFLKWLWDINTGCALQGGHKSLVYKFNYFPIIVKTGINNRVIFSLLSFQQTDPPFAMLVLSTTLYRTGSTMSEMSWLGNRCNQTRQNYPGMGSTRFSRQSRGTAEMYRPAAGEF